MNKKLIEIKRQTMKKSWKLGLIKSRPIGIEKQPLKIGSKFNHLTIINFHHFERRVNYRTYFYYLCKCDCGNKKIIIKDSILNGDTKSCGCYHRKRNGLAHRKEKYYASLNRIYKLYKIRAYKNNIKFSLNFLQFKNITSKNCFYCGTKPMLEHKSQKGHCYGTYKYNGLDRINSNKDYNINNVVACCKYCNYAKNDLSPKKFYAHIKKIYEYFKKK